MKPEARGGSSCDKKLSDYARATEGGQGSLADYAPRKEANICGATEHEFGPTAAQYLEPLTIIERTGGRFSGFSSDGADDDRELETTVPLGDEDAGSDQALDE